MNDDLVPEAPADPRRPRFSGVPVRLFLVGLVALVATVGGGLVLGFRGGDDIGFRLLPSDEARADYRYVIPAGAGADLAAGRPLDLLPQAMEVRVGEVIEIVNDDDRGHLVGPFFVGANETLRQEFASTGVFEGVCSVHPSGQIVITVR